MTGVTAGVNAMFWAVEGSTGVVHVSWRPSVGALGMSTLLWVLRPPLYAPSCFAALGFESRVRSAGISAEAREIDRGGGRGVAKRANCGQMPFRYIQARFQNSEPQIIIPSLGCCNRKLITNVLDHSQKTSAPSPILVYWNYVHFSRSNRTSPLDLNRTMCSQPAGLTPPRLP